VTLRTKSFVWIGILLPCIGVASPQTSPGVTFASKPGTLFVSARAVANDLKVSLVYDSRSDLAFLGSIPLDYRCAVGDQRFVAIDALKSLGARISSTKNSTTVSLNGHEMKVTAGRKSAVVDKTHQQIRIYQGGALVLTSKISTGKYSRSTPDGTFRIGYSKDAYHTSAKYNDAPMPWAVHVTRNIFIHGGDVPDYPASHGCVRLPDEAAEWFYNWVEPGTIVTIRG
jgi:lipoprotein-anchoring transpeptidase ErfK/SrfK